MIDKKRTLFKSFLEANGNIIIFLPYFFSVSTLLKTLFSPWKNLTVKKKSRAFSLNEYLNVLSFNLISRVMGFIMRLSILIFYLLVQTMYVILLPLFFLLFLLTIPIALLKQSFTKDEVQTKEEHKEDFIKKHLLAETNKQAVETWFEFYFQNYVIKHPWWELKQLFSIPPLARDWAMGYTPLLDEYVEDLTSTSYQLKIRGHIFGRTKESALIERVLSQSEEANAVIVGEKGIGKHTIIDAFARRMYEGRTNSRLAYKRLLKLNMEKILTEHTDNIKREEFFEELMKEAENAKNAVILIDNIEHYISNNDGNVDLSSSIEKYASSSSLQFIAITTPFMYEKYMFHAENIRNMYAKIDVEEVPQETALQIILDKAIEFEKKYKLTIPYETVLAIIEKSNYYINTIPFPEKALQLLDWVCTFTVESPSRSVVSPGLVDVVITNRTHVPTTLSDKIKQKLLHLESLISSKIVGQDEAIKLVSATLRRSFLLIGKRKKPIGSFLFLGPTGVGKTETAKIIAEVFFGTQDTMIRFDMSLYQTKEEIPKLIGSIETLNPGLLTNAIRENAYGVLLIDEIEKANRDLLNIFLTILDEGYFTDGFGQRVDCKNLIIIATSNAGASEIHGMLVKQALTEDVSQSSSDLINHLVEKGYFLPEFLNRFDGVVVYKPIRDEDAMQIARQQAATIIEELKNTHQVAISISDATLKSLIEGKYNIQFGARNLERILRTQIEDKIAKMILEGSLGPGQTLNL